MSSYISLKLKHIEELISKYKISHLCIDDKLEIKNDFVVSTVKLLHYIESEIDKNMSIKRKNYKDIFVDIFNISNKLIKYNKDENFECANEIGRIISFINKNIAHSKNVIRLKKLVTDLLNNINSSKILTGDETSEFIMPIINRINKKYK